MSRKKIALFTMGIAALTGAVGASATETITYIYDARGRLIKVVSTGSVNNNNQTCYKIDKADNRTNIQANVGSLDSCLPISSAMSDLFRLNFCRKGIGWSKGVVPRAFALAAICAAGLAAQATADTVNTYVYDARGRLIVACQATPSSGSRTAYSLDRSDNRTNVTSYDPSTVITVGSGIHSADGRFYLTLQTDGNLVLYGPSGALWATYTVGSGASVAVLQSYGNLVVYTSTGSVVWWNGVISHCANLVVQNDGNVVIYATTGQAVWSTGTGGH